MTQTQEHNVPALRFPEFSGEWDHHPIKELAEVKTGSRDTQNRIPNGKYPFYVRSDTIERINSFAYDGEAILTSGDGVGVGKNIHYVNEKFDYHQRVYAIYKFKEGLFGPFFFQFFKENFLRRVMRLSAKNSVDSVRMSMITDMPVPAPTLPEQQKIASFLSQVDRKIAQLGEKKALLQAYKKGMMQKLFSQELRFKDPQGHDFPDWEEKRLGEVAVCLDNKRKPLNSTERASMQGPYPYYGANGQLDSIEDYIFDERIVLLAEDGGNFDAYATRPIAQNISGKCWVNNHAHILRAKIEICDHDYLFQSLVHKDIRKYINGSSRAKLNKSDMMSIKGDYPSLPEQQKIADFLSSIDRKIDLVATELDHAKTFKKGLLQQMFI